MRLLFVFFLLVWPGAATAQYWATREFCDVEEPRVHPDLFAPYSFEQAKRLAAKKPNSNGNFWRITSPDGSVSHLWGTMHSNDPQILKLPDRLEQEIKAARIVFIEADFISQTRRQYEINIKFPGRVRDTRGGDFDTLGFDNRLTGWIRSRTAGMGSSRELPNHLTLGGLVEVVLASPCNDFAHGVLPIQDSRIQMLALIAGAEVRGLEEPDALVQFLNKPENADIARALISVFGSYLNPKSDPRNNEMAFSLYLSGQNGLHDIWKEAHIKGFFPAGIAENYHSRANGYLIDYRNLRFLETARADLMTGGALMAMGSGHIAGENGMVEILRRDGFIVNRVPLPGEVE